MNKVMQKKLRGELKRVIPLNTLGDDEFSRLLVSAEFKSVPKGEYIIRRGDTDSYNIYLLKGTLALSGKSGETDTVSAHESSARFPIAHQVPRKYSVRANTKAEIAKIDNRLLGELLLKKGDTSFQVEESASGTKDDWMSQLLRLPAFRQIPAANMQSVMMRMEEIDAAKGDLIIREGDEGDYFYMIHQGRCQVAKRFLGEEPEAVAELGAGDSFGEEALLSNKPRGSSVSMLTDGVLVRLSKEDFLQFVKHPVTRETSPAEARKRIEEGAVWLDVRPREVYEKQHLPDSINLPLPSLRYQSTSLDPETTYVVCCEDGRISNTAAFLLRERGFDALVLSGGLAALAGTDKSLRISSDSKDETAGRDTGIEEVSAAIEELKSALSTSNASLKTVKSENLDYRTEKTRLQDEITRLGASLENQDELRERLDASATEITALRTEIETGRNEIDRITKRLTSQAKVQEQLDSSAAEVAALTAKLRTSTSDIDRLQRALDAARRDAEAALSRESRAHEDRAQQFEREKGRLSGQIERYQSDVDQLKETLAGNESRREEQERKQQGLLAGLESQLAIEKSNSHTLSSELASLSKQYGERIEELRRTEENERSLIERLSEREEELKRVGAAVSAGEARESSRAAEHRDEVDRLRVELESVRHEHLHTRDQLRENAAERDRLRGECDAFALASEARASERERERERAESLLGEVARLEEQRDREGTERENLRRRLNEVEAESGQSLERARTEISRLKESLENSRKENSSELQRVEREMEALRVEYDELARQMRTEREEETRHAEALQAALDETNQELVSARAREETLRAELDEGRKDIGERERAGLQRIESLTAVIEQRDKALAAERDAFARQSELLKASLQERESGAAEQEALHEESTRGLKDRIGELTDELDRIRHARSVSDEAHAEAMEARTREISSLRESLASLQGQHREETEALSRELADTASKLTLSEDEHRQTTALLRSELDAALSERDRLRVETESSRSERSLLESKISGIEAEERQLRSLIGELRQQNRELSAGPDTEEAAALRSELKLVRVQANMETANLERQLHELRAALEEARTNAESSQGETALLGEQLEARTEKIDLLRERVGKAEKLAVKRKRRIDEHETTIQALQTQIGQLRQSDIQQQKGNETRVQELTLSLEKSTSKVRSLEKSLEQSEKKRAAAKKQHQRLQIRLDNLQGQVETTHDGERSVTRKPWGLGIASLLVGVVAGLLSSALLLPEGVTTRWSQQLSTPATPGPVATTPEPLPTPPADSDRAVATPTAEPAPSSAKAPAGNGEQTVEKPAVTRSKSIRDRLRNGRPGPEMVEIPGGTFAMGSSRSMLSPEEQPEHDVTIEGFHIGRYEVTFDEYALFASATGRDIPDDNGWGRGKRPVINVKWGDAVAYAAWISRQTGAKYRLPSEAEWEYAARAGTDTAYWWGYETGENRANCFDCGSRWDGRSTAPVGSFEPNPYGVEDTAGNVMEWMADCFHGNYRGAPDDGRPWMEKACAQRMIRGGAFNKPSETMKSSRRLWNEENTRLSHLGFRLVRETD